MGNTETANTIQSSGDPADKEDLSKPGLEEKPDEKKKEDDEGKAEFSNFWRILKYGTRADWLLMGAASLCSIGAGVTLPLMNVVFGHITTDFNGYFMPGTTVTQHQFLAAVSKNALYIVYLFIAKFVLAYVSMFSFRMTGIRISAAIRLAYLRALFAQPISVFDNLPSGKPTTLITSSSNTIQMGISEKLSTLIQFSALTVGAYAVAFRYSWQLTLVSSSVIVFILLVYGVTVPIHIRYQRAVEQSDEKASAIAGEVFASIRTVVACGAEGRIGEKYAGWMTESRRRGLLMSPTVAGQWAPAFFAMYCNFALTFWFGIKLYSEGHIGSSGTVVTVFFSVLLVTSALGQIAMPIMGITKAASASTSFFTIIDAPIPSTAGLKEPEASSHKDITFNDVTFAYPSRPNVKVLDDLNVTFSKGKITAIVGPSGSGKSTIVGLLERWYRLSGDFPLPTSKEDTIKLEEDTDADRVVNSGAITVGDHDVQDLDLKWWRTQIGLVQQEPFSFNDTIFKNVEYGLVGSRWENETADVKRKLVEEACHEAFADEFINRLPQGYETMIGENGIKLSGGQRQRLAIARSIIKRPTILILDEATSSIDVRGERIVQEALDRVSKNRTTITIAHRLSTIMKAHNIVVMKHGAVVEQGTHESLLAATGVYYDLVNAQHLSVEDNDASEPNEESSELGRIISTKSKDGLIGVEIESELQSDEPALKPKGFVQIILWFLYEQRAHYTLLVCLLLGAIGGGAAFSIQSFIFSKIIVVFQYVGKKLVDGGNFWALMFFVQAIGVGVSYFIVGFFANSISAHVSTTYRQQYFENILAKPISFYDSEGHSAGTLTSQLSTDPTKIQELFGPNMALPLISVFNVIGCIAIAFAYGWKLTLVTMFSAFPVIFTGSFVRVRYELQFEKLNSAVFAESSQFAAEAIDAFRTVTSLTLEDTITNRYAKLLRGHVVHAFKKARLATLIFAASDSIDLLCMALAFWYGGRLLSTREYNVEQFFVIYIAIIQGGQGAGIWSSFAPNIAQSSAAANRILGLRDRPKSSDQVKPVAWNKDEGGPRIEFNRLKFNYPTRDVPVFKDLNLTIESGQFAALVGPSGCGKTTVVTLLERFYEPQSGSITCDGVDISSLDMVEYRNSLSLVSQEPTLYQGSVKDNVLLGVDPTQVIDEQIQQACKDAEIHDFIVSLPSGYDTDVGLKGVALSGGQKQRISIARALVRKPRVLLLDEATSSLDSESERLVQAAFERAAKGRTMVVVAHRLATVQNADVIFVFGEGERGVVEVGSHRDLLRKRGVYWQMCQAQALDR